MSISYSILAKETSNERQKIFNGQKMIKIGGISGA